MLNFCILNMMILIQSLKKIFMNPDHIKQIDFIEMIKNKLTFKRPLPQPIYIEYDPLKDFSNQTNKL